MALLILITVSLATVFIPTPQSFTLKLKNYLEIDVFNKKCKNQSLSFAGNRIKRSESYPNQINLWQNAVKVHIANTGYGRDDKPDKYLDLDIVWRDADLFIYYKNDYDEDFRHYKTYLNEQGNDALKFKFTSLESNEAVGRLIYNSCGRVVHFNSQNDLPSDHIGDSVLLDMDLMQYRSTSFSLTGQLMENYSNHPNGHYLLVFKDIHSENGYLFPPSLGLLVNGNDIYGSFGNRSENAMIDSNMLAKKLTIINPEGILLINGNEYELTSQSVYFSNELILKNPFWKNEPRLNFRRYNDIIEISGEAGSIKYKGINMLDSFIRVVSKI